MKILYMTDTHIRGTSPRSRTDDFQQAIREKIEEVIDIAERERVDLVLHGGDLFDRPNLSPPLSGNSPGCFAVFRPPFSRLRGIMIFTDIIPQRWSGRCWGCSMPSVPSGW